MKWPAETRPAASRNENNDETDVTDTIRRTFQRSAEIDANHIVADAHDRTVTLRGTVRSWTERDDATRAAYSVPGISKVENFTTIIAV